MPLPPEIQRALTRGRRNSMMFQWCRHKVVAIYEQFPSQGIGFSPNLKVDLVITILGDIIENSKKGKYE